MASGRGGRVRIYLDVETRQLEAGLKRADRSMMGLDRSARRTGGVLDRFNTSNVTLSGSLKNAAKAAGAAAAAYIGIQQAKDAVTMTTDLAKATLVLNKNLGLSVKTASGFAAVAKTYDVDTRSLAMVTKTLSTNMEAAKQGTESSTRAFQQLGISQKELRSLNADQMLFRIADGAKALGDGSARTATMGKLLGRGFATLSPVLRQGADGMREWIAEAERNGLTLKGKTLPEIQKLIKEQRKAKLATMGLQVAFGTELAPALSDAFRTFGDVVRAIKKVPAPIKAIFNPIGNLIRAFRDMKAPILGVWRDIRDGIEGFVNDIIDVINVIPGPDIGHVGGGDSSKPPKGVQGPVNSKGKPIQGAFSGARVTSPMAIVGEEAPRHPEYVIATNPAYRGRNLKLLAGAAKELGVPGFALGGIVDDIGSAIGGIVSGLNPANLIKKLPDPGDLPGVVRGLGPWLIDRAKNFIRDQLTGGLGSDGMGRALVPLGHALQKAGFQVGGHPAFGGATPGAHASGSYHYSARAIDVNWPNASAEPSKLRPLYNALARTGPTELFYQNRGIPGPVDDHYDHLHLAYKQGGIVGKPSHGSHWIKGGPRWDVNEAATLLWQVGATPAEAKLLSSKLIGESGGNPRAVGNDPGGTTGLGLWQITTGYNDDIIQRFGGRGAMFNPIQNAKAALAILRRQGIGAWYAPTGQRGRILKERVRTAKSAGPKGPGAGIPAPSYGKGGKKGNKKKPGSAAPEETDLSELVQLLREQLVEAQKVNAVLRSQSGPNGVIMNALHAMISGSIGGRVGLGAQTPSYAGGLAAY